MFWSVNTEWVSPSICICVLKMLSSDQLTSVSSTPHMIWVTHPSEAVAVNPSWFSIISKLWTDSDTHLTPSLPTAGHRTVEMFHALPLAAVPCRALINNASQFPAYSNRLRDALKWTRLTLNFVDIISSWHLNSLSRARKNPRREKSASVSCWKPVFTLWGRATSDLL